MARKCRATAVAVAAFALLGLAADCEFQMDTVDGAEIVNDSGVTIRVLQLIGPDAYLMTDAGPGGRGSTTIAGVECNDRTYIVRVDPGGAEIDRREPGTLCVDDVWIIGPPDESP